MGFRGAVVVDSPCLEKQPNNWFSLTTPILQYFMQLIKNGPSRNVSALPCHGALPPVSDANSSYPTRALKVSTIKSHMDWHPWSLMSTPNYLLGPLARGVHIYQAGKYEACVWACCLSLSWSILAYFDSSSAELYLNAWMHLI